jgi:hypothetical protein
VCRINTLSVFVQQHTKLYLQRIQLGRKRKENRILPRCCGRAGGPFPPTCSALFGVTRSSFQLSFACVYETTIAPWCTPIPSENASENPQHCLCTCARRNEDDTMDEPPGDSIFRIFAHKTGAILPVFLVKTRLQLVLQRSNVQDLQTPSASSIISG